MKEMNLQQRLELRSRAREKHLSDDSRRSVVTLLNALLAEYFIAVKNDEQTQERKQ
jgi:hypothetical protein